LVGTLGVGEYLVVAGFITLFQGKYPSVTNLNPNQFSSEILNEGFNLADGGDLLRVFDNSHVLADFVNYADNPPWPPDPDGNGPSL